MIALLRSTDGNPDSRFEKYIAFLNSKNISYLTFCWDRNDKFKDNCHQFYFKRRAKYGSGIKNAINLLRFNIYLIRQLYRHRSDYNIIHAADLDTIIPAIFMKILFRKRIIYDIYDWYIDSRGIHNPLIKTLILGIEYISIKLSDVVIICEEGRKNQIKFTPHRLWIIPNIPTISYIPSKKEKTNLNLRISYVGILALDRGLQNLIKLAQYNPTIDIVVAGFGPLEKTFTDVSTQYKNINFLGSVSYKTALRIMSESDLIYAMYEKSNQNHIYAAPNKYYEGLALGTPIITTIGTLVGEKTLKSNTGYVIDESYDELDSIIKKFDHEEHCKKSENARSLWKNKYCNSLYRYLNDNYLSMIMQHDE